MLGRTKSLAVGVVVSVALVACASDDDGSLDDADVSDEQDDADAGDVLDDLDDAEIEAFLVELDSLDDDEYFALLDEFGLDEADVQRLVDRLDGVESGTDDDTDGDTDDAGDGSEAATGAAGRDDVECDDETLGADELIDFATAHVVVDGRLGDVCRGEENETLLDAWRLLETIAPARQLSDLAVFSGFESGEDGSEVTLAFVGPLDDEGSVFQMSVNLTESAVAGDELGLTMAHEFSHVFNGVSTQVDRSADAIDDCATYFNGEGCYTDDSLMWAWIEEFWSGGLIDEIDPLAEATAADGQERCDREPGFFGAYAASNPEEDFAEAFSAYVFEVPAESGAQQEKLDWLAAQPGLAEFNERAVAAGLTPATYRFDPCG